MFHKAVHLAVMEVIDGLADAQGIRRLSKSERKLGVPGFPRMVRSMAEWVPETVEAQLTLQFYQWERWGWGWRVWSYPVELEPSFIPFYGHFIFETAPPVEDARRPFSLLPENNLACRVQG